MAEADAVARPPAKPAPEARWIYHPAVDLIVGCGAWSVPLLVLAARAGAWTRTGAVAFYVLALGFNYPHYMATVYRAYRTRTDFARYRVFTFHITLALAIVAAASHLERAGTVDLHGVHHLEPVALQRTKFRIAGDVRPARRRCTHGNRTSRAAPFLHRLLYFADAELPHRRVRRRTYPFSRARC